MLPKSCLRMSQTTEELSATLIRRYRSRTYIRLWGKCLHSGDSACLIAGVVGQLVISFQAHDCPCSLSSPCSLPVGRGSISTSSILGPQPKPFFSNPFLPRIFNSYVCLVASDSVRHYRCSLFHTWRYDVLPATIWITAWRSISITQTCKVFVMLKAITEWGPKSLIDISSL